MNDTFQVLSETPAKLNTILNRLEAQTRLDSPRAPGKWTPRQILAHLTDVEAVQRVRVMAMLSEDNPVMIGFNADTWATAGEYTTRDSRSSAEAFSVLHTSNAQLWAALTQQQLERRGTHPTRGEFSIAEWLGFVARHDLSHLAQLEASLS